MIKRNIVDEVKGFYYQNVISHMYIATTLLIGIIADIIHYKLYVLIAISSLLPHLYESISTSIRKKSANLYYLLGLCTNSFVFSAFVFAVSFEPTLTGLLLIMYSYTLISYGGFKLWLFAISVLCCELIILFFAFGFSDVLHAPYYLVSTAVIASCCFIIVTASYRYDTNIELINSRREMASLLKQQSILSKNLSRYLSSKLVEKLVNGDHSIEKHQRREVVVFFSDLCNFTSISEEMSPEDMSLILNQYLSKMSKIANKFDATIDKFIGDSVMVFFGAPATLGPKEDVLKCLRMATEMKKELSNLNKEWSKKGISHTFSVRMGIHQGWVTVGNFGSENQLNYTIIGTSVNIAARLEQQCPPDSILVSRRIMELGKGEFLFYDNGLIELKGIESPFKTFIMGNKHQYGSKPIHLVIEANENTVEGVKWLLKKNGIVASEQQ